MEVSTVDLRWKWLTVAGSFLLCSVACSEWYYGNLYVYVTSFILRHQAPSAYILSQWTLSIYLTAHNVGFLVSGLALDFTSKRVVLLVGILLGGIGVIAAYFTIHLSMTALNLTFGFLNGFGNGVTISVVMQYVAEWAGNDVGFLLGTVQSGLNIGGLVFNQFVTMYINPDQETPDAAVESFMFFSQDSVVDNVPSSLLILGLSKLVIFFVGFLMIRDQKTGHKNDVTSSTTYNSTGFIQERGRPDTTVEDGIASLQERTSDIRGEDNVSTLGNNAAHVSEKQRKDYNLWEMLKTKEYYLILFSFNASLCTSVITTSYYKVYGQLYIQDDYFLTLIGTLTGVIVIASRITRGYMLDILGVKMSLIAILSITPLFLPFYFFTPMQSKWLYMTFTFINMTSTGCFSVYGGFVVRCFGKSHFAKNFSTLALANCVAMLLLPPVAEELIVRIGWFALFCFPSAFCLIGLVLVVVFFPSEM